MTDQRLWNFKYLTLKLLPANPSAPPSGVTCASLLFQGLHHKLSCLVSLQALHLPQIMLSNNTLSSFHFLKVQVFTIELHIVFFVIISISPISQSQFIYFCFLSLPSQTQEGFTILLSFQRTRFNIYWSISTFLIYYFTKINFDPA